MNLINYYKYIIIFLVSALFFNNVSGQNIEFIIDKSYDNLSWNDFVNKVEKESDLHFFYQDSALINLKISIEKPLSIAELLKETLTPLNLHYSSDGNNIFITGNGKIKLQLSNTFDNI